MPNDQIAAAIENATDTAVAETAAQTAVIAADAAVVLAETQAAIVTAEAAAIIQEVTTEIEVQEDEISWLKNRVTALEATLQEQTIQSLQLRDQIATMQLAQTLQGSPLSTPQAETLSGVEVVQPAVPSPSPQPEAPSAKRRVKLL